MIKKFHFQRVDQKINGFDQKTPEAVDTTKSKTNFTKDNEDTLA
jgi:hypothetical protein